MLNLDDAGSGFTSRDMFKSRSMDIEYVQVNYSQLIEELRF